MTATIAIDVEGEVRRLAPAALPLSLGGPGSDVVLPGVSEPGPAFHLGLSEGELYVQPESGASPAVVAEGAAIASSRWLRDGDLLTVAGTRIFFTQSGDEARLSVRERAATIAPPAAAPPAAGASSSASEDGREEELLIHPAPFDPLPVSGRRHRLRLRPAVVLGALGAIALALALGYVVLARSVAVEVAPEPDRAGFDTRLPVPRLGGRYLLLPGSYRFTAEKQGYRPLDERVAVGAGEDDELSFELAPLPARLTLRVEPAVGVSVSVDGEPRGETPVAAIELEPGPHRVDLDAPGYRRHTATVEVDQPGTELVLEVELESNLAPLTVTSAPVGATVELDGAAAGSTPLTVEVEEGSRRVLWRLPGYRPVSRRVEVTAGEPLSVAAELAPAAGNLTVVSDPADAALSIDGVYRGQTPVELDLAPGSYRVQASKPGYEPTAEEVRLAPGESSLVELALVQQMAELRLLSRPPGAEVLVDGEPRGVTGVEGLVVSLPAGAPRRVEVRKEGFVPFATTVTPRPGLGQSLEAVLVTPDEARAAKTPPAIETAAGQRLVLVDGGRFTMGAPRREPGRRVNEVRREVELTRPFYLATRPVTNRELREFASGHASGGVGSVNLEIDHHPAVRVSWDTAARYCNWLSAQESLPPAYVVRGGRMVAAETVGTGYRLPTEAEWSWVARGGAGRKYPWGDDLPIQPDSGNFGGAEARAVLGGALPGYRDAHVGTAPPASLPADRRGLHHIGSNVAEWMHDVYAERPGKPGTVERDPIGVGSSRLHVIRGASWMTVTVTDLRLSRRDSGSEGRPDVGFRIARYAEE